MAISVLASSTQTTSGTGAAVDLGVSAAPNALHQLALDVSAVSGTGASMVVTVETSRDQVTWAAVDAYPAVTATGSTPRSFVGLQRYVRAKWALTGTTPSFTFSLSGETATVYANATDLKQMALQGAALNGVSASVVADGLISASGMARRKLETRYSMPLTSWGLDLRRAVALVAQYDIMTQRGYSPEPGARDVFRDRYMDGIRELDEIAASGSSSINDSSAPILEGAPDVITSDPREW